MDGRGRRFWSLAMFAAILVAGSLLPGATALGRNGRTTVERFAFQLSPVPHDQEADGGSSARAAVRITRRGDQVTVSIRGRGLSPNLVHAQHIHGIGQNQCPTADARDDRVDDGLLDTVEGLPSYGGIAVSLTTSGDTTANSGLAVDRFPVADSRGTVSYSRTFTIGVDFPVEVADNLASHHIVMHGIDVNNNGEYDFGAGPSSLTSSFPLEATVPSNCGLIHPHH